MPDYRDLMYGMGGPLDAYQAIDAYRNKLRDVPEFHGMDPQDQSGFDRYSQMALYGKQFGPEAPFYMRAVSPLGAVGGTVDLGLNELSKMIPGAQSLIGRFTGDTSFQPNDATSRPSWSNFMSGMGGLVEGMAPGLFR